MVRYALMLVRFLILKGQFSNSREVGRYILCHKELLLLLVAVAVADVTGQLSDV